MRKQKYPNSQEVIEAFYKAVSESYNHPTVSEIGDTPGKKKQELLAEEFETTRLRIRKILITTGDYRSPITAQIQEIKRQGEKPEDVLNLSRATVNSLIPYQKGVYKLKEVSAAAERTERYRNRKEAARKLLESIEADDYELWKTELWKTIIAFQNYPFTTSGRGARPGIKFTYTVSAEGGESGKHYNGEVVEGYGNELIISGKERTISRSTVERAVRNALEMGRTVPGPKALGVPGAHSYLYAMLQRFGVISGS